MLSLHLIVHEATVVSSKAHLHACRCCAVGWAGSVCLGSCGEASFGRAIKRTCCVLTWHTAEQGRVELSAPAFPSQEGLLAVRLLDMSAS